MGILGASFILVLVVEEVGQEDQQDYDRCGGDGEVFAGWVLDVGGEVAEVWYREDGFADQVLIVYGGRVGVFVGVALGVEVLIGIVYFDYAVCGYCEVFVEDEGYGVAYLDVLRVGFLDVDQ